MPEVHETRMGQIFFSVTMPEIALQLRRIATALEKNKDVVLTKENILKYTDEDELFALFGTFKEYYVREVHDVDAPYPLDEEIGKVIEKLKANYK